MFPGAGNYSGVGIPLDPLELLPEDGGYGTGPGVYARILEMRKTQAAIMKARQHTYHKKQVRFLDTIAGVDFNTSTTVTGVEDTVGGGGGKLRGAGVIGDASLTLLNVYAGNLTTQLDISVEDSDRLVPDTISIVHTLDGRDTVEEQAGQEKKKKVVLGRRDVMIILMILFKIN